jgi:membrane protease YdiL (CAAX protease family)
MSESQEGLRAPEVVSGTPANERFAARLRGFGALGLLGILIILAGNLLMAPLSAILVLLWGKISRTPWREIGYVRPRSWIGTVMIGVAFGVVFKFAMKAIVMPLLGAPPINEAYHFLAGNTAAIPWMLYVIIAGAGFGEETVFRGWMFERLGKLFGQSVAARIGIVVITSLLFALAHYTGQGIPGVQQALVTGLTFGTIFALTGRIFMLMIAHAAFDLTALWMIYYDLEARIAHLIFT